MNWEGRSILGFGCKGGGGGGGEGLSYRGAGVFVGFLVTDKIHLVVRGQSSTAMRLKCAKYALSGLLPISPDNSVGRVCH